jgi:hypothetical protein
VRLALNVAGGGRLEAEGNYTPAGPVVDLKLKLADLALKLVEPLLAGRTTLQIADGRLSTQGQVTYGAKGAEPGYRGDFSVRDLRLKEQGSGEEMLAWKNLATQQFTVTPTRLDIGELRLNGLDTKLIINKDKSINLMRVLKPAASSGRSGGHRRRQRRLTSAEGASPAPAAAAAPSRHTCRHTRCGHTGCRAGLRCGSLPGQYRPPALFKGELDFADLSLMFPFATRIHNLRGSIGNLSSRPGAPGQLELDGEVDEFGMARAVGQVDLFNPTDNMDIKLVFRNVDMSRLTPYMATFAGRRIESGKLSLDLEYKIQQRQLKGENQVVIDRLTLGERVESPGADSLPLDLAIAILQDSDGRIDLGLPVAGSLDDPQFSYGGLIWKAITNVLTKIVTAPFRALGALFGGSGEKVENVAFEPGAKVLTPPEREKLLKVAAVLGKRPKLALAVGGIHAEVDRVALQEVQLRRAVLTASGLDALGAGRSRSDFPAPAQDPGRAGKPVCGAGRQERPGGIEGRLPQRQPGPARGKRRRQGDVAPDRIAAGKENPGRE